MTLKTMKRVAYVLAGIGLLDSIYLAWNKLSNNEIFCAGIGDCDVVNSSPYAEIAGIPIALLGAAAYVLLLGLIAVDGKPGFLGQNAGLMIFGITLAGTLYSAYLTYIEIAVLKAICPYCVVSAVAMVGLFGLAVWRLVAMPEAS